MILLLSTAYFPTVEYMVYLANAAKVTIDLHETYPKQTWRNRCQIMTGNGLVSLTVPVEKPGGNHTSTSKVLVSEHYNWRENHWKTIFSAYRNAPFFLYYCDMVEELIQKRNSQHLHLLNQQILNMVLPEIGLKVFWDYSSHFIKDPGEYIDRRFSLSPKAKDRAGVANPEFPPYYQVFEDRFGFQPNLSILDLLFNLGPDTLGYLEGIKILFNTNQ